MGLDCYTQSTLLLVSPKTMKKNKSILAFVVMFSYIRFIKIQFNDTTN